MREVVFKNMLSNNSRVKNIFLKEEFERDGVLAKTERRCFYYIKEITPIKEVQNLENWVSSKNAVGPVGKRHFHIFKEHNDSNSEDKLICKIIGTFYAIVNNNVYTVVFLHSFKVRFSKAHLKN
ncbi:MAG: hypothetical protein KBB52_02620 [Candidatus Omnitrophica bacterium]|nr:hypothetical protein [Candidatus Omnitrophota bacterium]